MIFVRFTFTKYISPWLYHQLVLWLVTSTSHSLFTRLYPLYYSIFPCIPSSYLPSFLSPHTHSSSPTPLSLPTHSQHFSHVFIFLFIHSLTHPIHTTSLSLSLSSVISPLSLPRPPGVSDSGVIKTRERGGGTAAASSFHCSSLHPLGHRTARHRVGRKEGKCLAAHHHNHNACTLPSCCAVLCLCVCV